MGDFNLIYKGQDKNNTRVNRWLMNRFRKTLNNLEVKEIHLIGKRYTWCNRQVGPIMSRIGRVFCFIIWEDQFSNPIVQPLSSSVSDHNPLLLTPLTSPIFTPRFKFEAYWPDRAGFQDCVKEAWTRSVPPQLNPMSVLHIKLSRTTKALKSWSRKMASQGKMTMTVCKEVIAQLDISQERRTLFPEERGLVKSLKLRLLALAAIEKSRARQRSRITWLRLGDANTKCFHLMANARKKKNYIHSLQAEGRVDLTHSAKHD
jgi:hypothetical protein